MRNASTNLTFTQYFNAETLLSTMGRYARENEEVASLILLTPSTAENRTIMALELRSDRMSKKPGILIVGGNIPRLVSNSRYPV